MVNQGEIKVDLDGKTISVPADGYSVGLLSISDLWKMVFQSNETMLSSSQSLEQLILKIRSGDVRTLTMVFVSVGVSAWFAYLILFQLFGKADEASKSDRGDDKSKEDEPIVLRDFTIDQLREYDGTDKNKPPYIGLCGEVYDVSSASDFYGKGGPYHCFSGRDASRAMAKFSLDEADLSNSDISDLGPFERSQLQDWVMKFKHYKCYPVVGKLSKASEPRSFTLSELSEFTGEKDAPAGRVHAPIYVGVKGTVFDVSFGGHEFYSKDGPYAMFAGKDVSRALAKMSFQPEDLNNSDLNDLNQQQLKTLDDWFDKFEKVKKYPIVGHLK